MAQGIKRKSSNQGAVDARDKRCTSSTHSHVRRDLLEQLYPCVRTLRDYLLAKLPSTSRLRRKKIAAVGRGEACRDVEYSLAHLLDTTLVCTSNQESQQEFSRDTRWNQWLSFSQKADESSVTISGNSEVSSFFSQSEIIDFVIWLLFSRQKNNGSWPKHILCDGFRRGSGNGDQRGTSIPGIFSRFTNSHVNTLKETPWPQTLALLGKSGERMMIDLLVDCSIFVIVRAGFGNYYQLSGLPLSEFELSRSAFESANGTLSFCRKPSDITLVRSRIFYAKPSLTSRGFVEAGFKHIHVLNRCPYTHVLEHLKGDPSREEVQDTQWRNDINTIKVMMHIFPRQFKLHNVFTSEVDRTQTAQKFQDYTVREAEIKSNWESRPRGTNLPKIPKRLRGTAKQLAQRLLILHGRCSYFELLKHYCPTRCDQQGRRSAQATQREHYPGSTEIDRKCNGKGVPTQHHDRPMKNSRKIQLASLSSINSHYESVAELSSPVAHVSSFCQAVLSKVIPDGFWGEGDTMSYNKNVVLRKVDHFIKLRRFETMSLHEIVQNLKVTEIPWLQQPHWRGQRSSQTDLKKRVELFNEFLYYVFDSVLMPLIRSNFYVTESNTHRYNVFYFRHDVWKHVAEPAMSALKETMLEEIKFADATRILESRSLGFSQIRLLPKGRNLRPIMNLRRRSLEKGGSKILGASINAVLGPVYTCLKLEKLRAPAKLGSTIFSVSEIYLKLRDFKLSLGRDHGRLYFAKLDVNAAFDTIPQDAVVRLMSSVPSQRQYSIRKHAEVKPRERSIEDANSTSTRPIRRWHSTASGTGDTSSFAQRLESDLGTKKRNTVFIDSAARRTHDAADLLGLLAEHVTSNLVKIGKKYYRQKTGIPQGSVLSSFLCNYFYADLEIHHLNFLDGSDSLLLRLIDDFILITLDKKKATRFVETMHGGLPDYGVEVNQKKTLVNFDMQTMEGKVQKTSSTWFPYCGTMIDCRTLEITKDRDKGKAIEASNSLTVEFGRSPGQNFERKVMSAFRIQSHVMYFDTTHNSTRTVLDTLYGVFAETARKMWAYIRCMPISKQPRGSLVIRAIIKVIGVAFLLLTGKSRRMRYEDYSCSVRRAQVAVVACKAFLGVLSRKQAGFRDVLEWLRSEISRLESQK